MVLTRYPGFGLLPAGADISPLVVMAFSTMDEILSSNLACLACCLTFNNIDCLIIICYDIKKKVLAVLLTNLLNTFLQR